MKRGLPFLFLCPFLFACGDGGVVRAEPKLSAPDRLDFGHVLISSKVTRSITLRNEGSGAATVQVEVPAPFSVEEEELQVPGRATRSLAFTFYSDEEGAAEAVALLKWNHGRIEVALSAEAVEPQICDPSDDCREVRFVPGQGCVEEWEPDGKPCERPCLEQATCLEGRCTGVQKDCADGDPCTHDYCDPILGCQNISDPKRACETDNPCKVPSCDPKGGCIFENVPDGTSCGYATCGVSMVCIGGICEQRDTAEGAPCGEATPCQPQGFCVEGRCEQPPPSPLPLRWEDGPIAGWTLHFDGVTDPQGRIYWVECGKAACSLATARPPEGETLRRSLFAESGASPRGRLLLSEGHLVSSYRSGYIEIHRSMDLERETSIDLRAALPEEASEWVAVEIAAHRDRGFALVEAREKGEVVQGWAIAFSLPSGEIEWSREMEGLFEGLLVDELGRLYLTWVHRDPDFGQPALVSMSREGRERWRMPVDFNAPLAVASGRLLDGDANLRRLEDGAIEMSLEALVPLSSRSAILTFELGSLFGYPLNPCGHKTELCPDWEPHLLGFDPWQGDGIDWLQSVSSGERWGRTEPLLTDDQAILLAQAKQSGPSSGCERTFVLQELRFEGGSWPRLGISCEFPGAEQTYEGAAALYDGVLVVANHCTHRLEAYFVGEDRQTAERGWVTAGGNPGRSGAPR